MTEKTENKESVEEKTVEKNKDKEVNKEVKKIIELKAKEKGVVYTPSFFDYDNNILAEQIYKDGKFMV